MPLAAHAQQTERMRRIGVLMNLDADDKEGQARLIAFVQALSDLGWKDGNNVQIETCWGAGETGRFHQCAAQLVAAAPNVILCLCFYDGPVGSKNTQHTDSVCTGHWSPSDSTLFWDRLPITLCFTAILAVVVEERVSVALGAALLWPLLATGLDRRSAALWLGTILSLPCIASAVAAVPAKVYRRILLDHCGGAICPRQAVRIPRPRSACEIHIQRAYAQAYLCSRWLFRGAEIFPGASTDFGLCTSRRMIPGSCIPSVKTNPRMGSWISGFCCDVPTAACETVIFGTDGTFLVAFRLQATNVTDPHGAIA